ncbi:hypothetical protein KFK09_021892 [Dendrobium nobile]|uniref:VQ domain-containing protein n=1 Tax=Dendrobium nobile TaxID=94219 RepID=A0A8T3AHT9_DENNO|nr:hypothetical protein KFK09_021892 [Dendrobium nobile]
MTDATSEPTADWAQFFNRPSSVHPFIATSIPADSTVVTTAPVAAAAASGGVTRSIGKAPPRKRSRASRRAPTTLLNTDTTNFRAMVQQFTGVPTGPYSTDGFGFGFGPDNPIRQPPAAMQQHQRQYYQFRPPQQQQQQQQDVMHAGYGMVGNGMDDGQVMPGFFIDGLGHRYTFNG